MVLVPILVVPTVLIAVPLALEGRRERAEQAVGQVVVVGAEGARRLVDFLSGTPGLDIVESEDPEGDLEAGKIQAVLYVTENFDRSVAAEDETSVVIAFDATDEESDRTHSRLLAAVSEFSARVAEKRLVSRGIDPTIVRAVSTSSRNVAPAEKMGMVFISMIMPMMLGIWGALGGMYAAIEATAGEKERGTLELLLAAPPSRISLAVGKFLVVTATAVFSSLVALGAIAATIIAKPETVLLGAMPADAALMPSGVQALALALPPANLALMAAAMVALASIFGAVQLTVSLYARSFREAQTYLSPVTLVVVLPAVFIQFIRAADVPGRVFTVPVLNVIFIFKELLEGPVNWTHFGTMLASSFITAYVCLRLMAAVFRNEQVLFRT